MIIGVDFDNTIINYENIFGQIADEKGLIPKRLSKDKSSVKKYLIEKGIEDEWTILQGEVYGKAIMKAQIFEGLLDTLRFLHDNKHTIYVVSHRTIYPYKGEKVNLHSSAKEFLAKKRFFIDDGGYVNRTNIFFETTIEEKIARVINLKCDIFIDDLPKILMLLPQNINKILFCPTNKSHSKSKNYKIISKWMDIKILLRQYAKKFNS